jgi:hypothetical protein
MDMSMIDWHPPDENVLHQHLFDNTNNNVETPLSFGEQQPQLPSSSSTLSLPSTTPISLLPSSSSASQERVVMFIFSLFSDSSARRCPFSDVEFRWFNGSTSESIWAHSFLLSRSEKWDAARSKASMQRNGIDGAQTHTIIVVPSEVRRATLLSELRMWYGGSIVQQLRMHNRPYHAQRTVIAPIDPNHADYAFYAALEAQAREEELQQQLEQQTEQQQQQQQHSTHATTPLTSASPTAPSPSASYSSSISSDMHNEVEQQFIEEMFGREVSTLYDYVLQLLNTPHATADASIRIPATESTGLDQSLQMATGGQYIPDRSAEPLLHDVVIPVHRAILAKRCPWFVKVFSPDSSFQHSTVAELAASESVVRAILRYGAYFMHACMLDMCVGDAQHGDCNQCAHTADTCISRMFSRLNAPSISSRRCSLPIC